MLLSDTISSLFFSLLRSIALFSDGRLPPLQSSSSSSSGSSPAALPATVVAPSPSTAPASTASKDDSPSLKEMAQKIAELQSAATAKAAAAAAAATHKTASANSAENWHSPGDLGLLSTLLVVAFVIGSIFLVCYIGHRQGWWSGDSKKGKYDVLPTRTD